MSFVVSDLAVDVHYTADPRLVTIAGVKLSNLVREQYLSAVISQDQAFFDRVGSGEIASRASKDIDSIRTGLGERLGYLIWASSTIIAVSTINPRIL